MSTADRWGNTGTGVTVQDAEAHPEWYLRNTSGDRFTFRGYDYLWAADIGNRDYQERWAANVTAKLQEPPTGTACSSTTPTRRCVPLRPRDRVAKYPNDAAYQVATGSALAVIGPRLRAQGKLVDPELRLVARLPDAVTPWLKYVSGGMEEHFTKFGDSPARGPPHRRRLGRQPRQLKQVQAMGKLFLGIAHSSRGDRAAARYGWATMLLAADGRATFALHDDYTRETWFPEYDYDLGAPKGPESETADGVHRRAFERGLVVVNPTTDERARALRRALPRLRARALDRRRAAPAHGARAALRLRAAARARAQGPPALAARPRLLPPGARPCRRVITVAVRAQRSRVIVGRRHVALRRSARVHVRLSARGRDALQRGRRLARQRPRAALSSR